ncbi:MAG: hypothetical protein K2X03_08135 [Bryobacteraceae bacterium]|nr:hypothetical protein [Bryobacteraceae bacterium]
MKRLITNLLMAGALTVAAVPSPAAVVFRTGVFVRPAYSAWGYGPGWAPGPYYGSVYVPPTHRHEGQLKFDNTDKDAQVYLDGAFAGTVRGLNSSWLREGQHDVELRSHGDRLHERIYVVAGKTAHVRQEALTPSNS